MISYFVMAKYIYTYIMHLNSIHKAGEVVSKAASKTGDFFKGVENYAT